MTMVNDCAECFDRYTDYGSETGCSKHSDGITLEVQITSPNIDLLRTLFGTELPW